MIFERLYAFPPDKARAEFIDLRVRASLADSLSTIFDQIGPTLTLDQLRAKATVTAIRARPPAPRQVATYADLVEAVYADDETLSRALAHSLLEDSLSEQDGFGRPRVLTLSDAELGTGQAARYARYALADTLDTVVRPASSEDKARLVPMFDEVLALLEAAAPELLGEIQNFVREVVLVDGRGFGGATSFYLWGAMLLNASRLTSRVSFASAVIHEAAHALQFGVALGAPLTENDRAERCASPLRADARPVEGVFHATVVLARMIYGLDRFIASGLLTPAEAGAASRMVESHLDGFHAGLAALAPIARLTPGGEALLDGAKHYVSVRACAAAPQA